MRNYIGLSALTLTMVLFGNYAFAQITGEDMTTFEKLWAFIKDFDTYPTIVAKIATGLTLLVSLVKVSFIRTFTWDKLSDTAKDWVAPVIGLVTGVAMLFTADVKFDWALLLSAVAGGTLSPYLHDILDLIKKIPGLGQIWLTVIEGIKVIFLAPKTQEPTI